jgi:hypothetical protein
VRDYTKLFEKPAEGRLGQGERFLAGTPALPRGAITNRVLGVVVFGGMADLVAARGSKPGPVYEGQELPSTLALGVTPLRLMVFGMNVASGRPNKVLYDIPTDAIVSVSSRVGRSIGLKKLEVDILVTNGATLQVEIPREHVKKGAAFLHTLAAAASNSTPEAGHAVPFGDTPSRLDQPRSEAGWYPVGGDESQRMYWDGRTWTHRVQWDGSKWVNF